MVEVAQHLKGRDFVRIGTWNSEELKTALDLADELKELRKQREPHELLPGRMLGMIYHANLLLEQAEQAYRIAARLAPNEAQWAYARAVLEEKHAAREIVVESALAARSG